MDAHPTRHAWPPQTVPASFLAIDVETTGFSPAQDRVIEVAWARFVDGVECQNDSHVVNPHREIPWRVTQLTGLNARRTQAAPRFRAVAGALVTAIESARCVVAYNAPFDRRFICAELARAGMLLPDVPWVDALSLARAIDAGEKGFSLRRSCDRHAIALDCAHQALSDARATGELFVQLCAKAPPRRLRRFIPASAFAPPTSLAARVRTRLLGLFG